MTETTEVAVPEETLSCPDGSEETIHDESRFIENIAQFFNQEMLSDIILKVGDRQFFAHSFVLAKSSEVFRTMLFDKGWKSETCNRRLEVSQFRPSESEADPTEHLARELEQMVVRAHVIRSESSENESAGDSGVSTSQSVSAFRSVVEICETSECEAVFDQFLSYLYSARIQISPKSAVGILCLADKYNVAELKDVAVNYMVRNARSPRVQNALRWYEWAKALSLPRLFQQCFKTVVWNIEQIIRSHSDTWLALDVDFLSDILGSSEIVVSSEHVLFEAVHGWLLHESRLNKLASNAARLLSKVRFAQMLVSQLYAIEQCDLWNCSATRELMHALVAKAYRFRALCPAQRELNLSFADCFFAPRDYVQLAVDTIRISSTMRFGLQVDAKMYVGPCPQPSEKWTGDWKITCRKQHSDREGADRWTFNVYCHDSAMLDNEARFQLTILVYNAEHRIIQVEATPAYSISRGVQQAVQMELEEEVVAHELAILIKPLPLF